MLNTVLLRVILPYAVAGMISDEDGNILHAAPILSWTVGKKANYVLKWVKSKNGKIEVL